MKFLADHCVSKRTTDFLIGEHYDVATLKELGLQDLKDAEIIKLAIARDDVLITEDKGFGNILDYPPHTHQGVIVLNVRTRSRKALHCVLAQFLSSVNRDQLRQALIQVDERLARVRR